MESICECGAIATERVVMGGNPITGENIYEDWCKDCLNEPHCYECGNYVPVKRVAVGQNPKTLENIYDLRCDQCLEEEPVNVCCECEELTTNKLCCPECLGETYNANEEEHPAECCKPVVNGAEERQKKLNDIPRNTPTNQQKPEEPKMSASKPTPKAVSISNAADLKKECERMWATLLKLKKSGEKACIYGEYDFATDALRNSFFAWTVKAFEKALPSWYAVGALHDDRLSGEIALCPTEELRDQIQAAIKGK